MHTASEVAVHGEEAAGMQCFSGGLKGQGTDREEFEEEQSVHCLQDVDPAWEVYVPAGHGVHETEMLFLLSSPA